MTWGCSPASPDALARRFSLGINEAGIRVLCPSGGLPSRKAMVR